MPRQCADCRLYADDPAPAACPACGGPMKLTLLARPGDDPPLMPGVPTTLSNRYARWDEFEDDERSSGPNLLSGLVPARYQMPLLFLAVLAVAAAVVAALTAR